MPESVGIQGEPGHGFKGILVDRFPGIVVMVRELNQDKDEEGRDEYQRRVVKLLLHEGQHQYLQGDEIRSAFEEIEKTPEVMKIKEKIKGGQDAYVGQTKELITSYIDSYTKDVLFGEIDCDDLKLNHEFSFDFSVNEEDVKDVAVSKIRSEVEIRGGKGPDEIYKNCWQKKLGHLPKGYENPSLTEMENSVNKKRSKMSVYDIGRTLDKGLIEKYLREGKQIDKGFILEVWKMVGEKADVIQ
jgi:hypothetical protein